LMLTPEPLRRTRMFTENILAQRPLARDARIEKENKGMQSQGSLQLLHFDK